MPHFSIEYSANLEATVNFGALCAIISDAILATGYFEVGAVRVRAVPADAYAIADRSPRNGFVDMSLRIGEGRSAAQKREMGDKIFEAVSKRFAKELAEPYFALSLEIREIDKELSWKLNSMHSRLRNKESS